MHAAAFRAAGVRVVANPRAAQYCVESGVADYCRAWAEETDLHMKPPA